MCQNTLVLLNVLSVKKKLHRNFCIIDKCIIVALVLATRKKKLLQINYYNADFVALLNYFVPWTLLLHYYAKKLLFDYNMY